MKKVALATALTALMMFGGLSPSAAFKALDEEVGLDRADSANLSTPPGLETIHKRNLNQAAKGALGQAAIDVVDDLMNAAGCEAVLKRIQTDNLGYQHIRLTQRYKGLPVVGAEIIAHINNQDVIYQINGKYLSSIEVSVEAQIDADSALQIGLDEHQSKTGLRVSKEPSLVIYGPYLAYHYVISYEGEAVGQWWYYVDAHTGKLLFRYNNIKPGAPNSSLGHHDTVQGDRLTGEDGASMSMTGFYEDQGSGNYFLYNFDDVWGIFDETAGDWEQRATSNWGTRDRHAISCGVNFEAIQDWVSTVLGRDSFDDSGALARANVHATGFLCPVNAWWDGTDFHFCDGDGSDSDELCVLDVAAHEYGHAITDYTSNLVYSYESGALNESYSDVMGAAVEFDAQPDGTAGYPSATPGHSDWLLGEDCWLPGPGDALRDMQDPQHYNQPSYYHGTHWYNGPLDNGGVHTNSGVQNFAYYLLAVGGSGTNDGHPYGPITGIGAEAAAAVALRANMVYLTSTAQYVDSRAAWISAAADLRYATETVEQVWDAVGVGGVADGITLLTPRDGAVLPALPSATFAWESAVHNEFRLQFSPTPRFPSGAPTISVPRRGWMPDTSTDTVRGWRGIWNEMRIMEQTSEIVYWRVMGTAPRETSELRSFTIE